MTIAAPDAPMTPQQRGAAARRRPRLTRFVAATMRRRRHNAFYSRLVVFLKIALPATAAALAALVLFWPQLNPLDNRFRLKSVTVGIDDLENLRMVSPRFVGTDERNQPFSITADQATQEAGGSDVTLLASPKGDISMNNGSWIALTAEQGEYSKETRKLTLADHVNVFHDAGYELKTTRAEADLGAGDVKGDAPVEGQGPDTLLKGQGFRITEKGGRISLTGRSQLVIYPNPPDRK